MRTFFPVSAILAIALLASSCEHTNPVGPSPLISTDVLITALMQQGATARRGDILPNALPCFSVSGRVVFVNTGSVNALNIRARLRPKVTRRRSRQTAPALVEAVVRR